MIPAGSRAGAAAGVFAGRERASQTACRRGPARESGVHERHRRGLGRSVVEGGFAGGDPGAVSRDDAWRHRVLRQSADAHRCQSRIVPGRVAAGAVPAGGGDIRRAYHRGAKSADRLAAALHPAPRGGFDQSAVDQADLQTRRVGEAGDHLPGGSFDGDGIADEGV